MAPWRIGWSVRPAMICEQWEEVKQCFHEALEQPAEMRSEFLLRACSDHIVRAEVERLLREHSRAGHFLSEPAAGQTNTFTADGCALFVGRVVGAYRLLRELGQGGMGAVWLGERTDGILKRPVAIKLPHTGVYGRHFIERFQREREILASLTHPHIGRLYDAGVTDEGEPFLALEYIEGTELITYCDSKQLGVRERLKLFLQVLGAVHYANSHLVIHRDLKPANILVGIDGQAKLLDFGVAKLILDGEANGTELTQRSGRALTPRYASPEQITAEPISIASDIYSLGVVLFELLTGERPYRSKADSRASLEDSIVAGDVVRPSQAVQNAHKARAANVKKLAAALKGDLDTIILKALARRPDQRYATADAFSQDVERYLNGQPVLAQAESAWYRWKKFAWRNRLSVAAAVAVILALVTGLTIALWEARKAREQAETAESVLVFMEGIFKLNSSNQPDPAKARETTVRELLDISAARLDTALNNVPAAKMRILRTLYDMYGDLDLWDRELDLARKRVELAQSMYSPSDPAVVDMLLDLATDAANGDLLAEEEWAVRKAGQILDKQRDYMSQRRASLEAALADFYLNVDLRQALAHSQVAVRLERSFPPSAEKVNLLQASVYYDTETGDYKTGEAVSTEALSMAASVPEATSMLPWIHKHLAEARDGAEDLTAAWQNYTEARELARKYHGAQAVTTPLIELAFADFLARTSRISQGLTIARPACDRALKLSRQGITASLLPIGVITYGRALIDYGRVEEGLEVLRQAEATRAHFPPALTILNIQLLEERAAGFIEAGHFAEAEALLSEAAKKQRQLNREHTPGYNRNLALRAHLLSVTGRSNEALKTLAEYQVFPAPRGRVSRSRLEERIIRSEISLSIGDFRSAQSLAAEARAAITNSPNRAYLAIWEARAALAEGQAKLLGRDARGALPLLERATALRTDLLDPSSPALADADIALSNCYLDLHNQKKASALLRQAKAIHRQHARLGEH